MLSSVGYVVLVKSQWGGADKIHITQRLLTPPLLINEILGTVLNTVEPFPPSVKKE